MVQVVTAALGRSRLGSKSASSSSNRGRSPLSQAPVSHWAQTVMKYINRRLLYISRSSSALFIDRPHLLTCRNIGEREPTLTLEALSLTYKCRGRVGPRESAAPVLSVNLLLQNASRSSAAPIPCTRPPDSLSADSTHTHTPESSQTDESYPEQIMHTSGSADTRKIPRLEADRKSRRKWLSSTKYTLPFYNQDELSWQEESSVATVVLKEMTPHGGLNTPSESGLAMLPRVASVQAREHKTVQADRDATWPRLFLGQLPTFPENVTKIHPWLFHLFG